MVLSKRLQGPGLSNSRPANSVNRRRFLGQAGAAAAVATGALAVPPAAFAQSSNSPQLGFGDGRPERDQPAGFAGFPDPTRRSHAGGSHPCSAHATNGDEARYPDKSGTYSKGLLQDGYGRVNLNAFATFRTALNSGRPSDFEKIIMGGTRTLNGPQGALAFGMEGTDAVQFGSSPSPANQESVVVVPAPPSVASPAYGTELVELYWASLLRDVAFTDFVSNPIAALAAKELSGMPYYAGPRDSHGHVTPDLLLRGAFPGETVGPYISQLFITPTYFGQQELGQQMTTYLPGIDYMTDLTTWQEVQNGIDTGLQDQPDPQPRYQHNGRGLASFTHVDVLYQAYFTAFLVLNTLGAPLNPGNPYVHSKTQNGFCSFGGPDIALPRRNRRPCAGCCLVPEMDCAPASSS